MANTHKIQVLMLMLFVTITCYAQRCEHVVKRGEDFESIAQTYSITVDELKAANPECSSCYTGKKLLIPYPGVPVERKPVEVTPIDLNLQSSSETVLTKTSTSAYQVGQALYKSKKYQSAIDYLNAAITTSEEKNNEGYYMSCLVMADIYFNGNGVDKDFERAKYYYHEYKNNAPKSAYSDDYVKAISNEIESEEHRIEQQELKEKREQQRLLAAQRKADAATSRSSAKKNQVVLTNQNTVSESTNNLGSVSVGTTTSDGSQSSSEPCSICGGSGKCYSVNAGPSTYDYYCNGAKKCQVCNGKGVIYSPFTQEPATCSVCNGTKLCGRCYGTGQCQACNGTGKKQ